MQRIIISFALCTGVWLSAAPKSPPPPALQKPLAADSENVIDIRPTKDFLELNETDPIPSKLLAWDKDSGATLFFSKSELPFVYLKGRLRNSFGLSINDRFVPVKAGVFIVKLSLPLAISTFTLKVFAPDRSFDTFRLLGFWTKVPPSFRVKVQDEHGGVSERSLGFTGRVKRAAFAQLYSEATPVSLVDLDGQKHAKLTFRVYYPPEPEQLYDAWAIIVRNSRGETVSEVRRYGSPPQSIDWREVSEPIMRRDTYFYQVNLYKEADEYPGIANRFETIEGLSLLRAQYSRNFEIEPRAEIGYYLVDHTMHVPTEPNHYQGVFVAADVTLSFWNTIILRGEALSALEQKDPNENFNFQRIGAGVRLYSHGENAWLGSPHLTRVDLLGTLCAFGIAGNSYVPRFIDYGLLFEPHFVLWAYNYITPWFEYAIRPDRGQKRLSFGVSYYFFVRPWSMKLGFGFASDRILEYNPPLAPTTAGDSFSSLRTYTSLIFFL
ncbi:MAG: hypothetical protein HYR96_00695 [Deltaproteobacteria bacterium]|nr:hypothetical protein [Deltaproteobacteria bacterium]MBI3294629.1 hypothetical protein [Deltaproteobacteria bacterium]